MHEAPTPVDWRTWPSWIRATRQIEDRHPRSAPAPSGPRPLSRYWGAALRDPVFVIGAPRSGTSFLGAGLGALPEFSYHYEPAIIKAAARYAVERRWRPERWQRVVRRTYRWLSCRRGDADLRFAEKTPQNCFVIEPLAALFPTARFVHILRDGRDAAVSHRETGWLSEASAKKGQRESGGYPLGPCPRFWVEPERREEFRKTSDLHRCIWAWRRHTESAQRALSSLAAERQCEIRYEDLVNDPRSEGERLLDFLQIEAAASRDRGLAHLRSANADSIGAWREQLSAAERAEVEREAGWLLERLGYPETSG